MGFDRWYHVNGTKHLEQLLVWMVNENANKKTPFKYEIHVNTGMWSVRHTLYDVPDKYQRTYTSFRTNVHVTQETAK